MLSWWKIGALREAAAETLKSDVGSVGYAAELETSMYLYIDPDAVDEEAVPRDISYPKCLIFYTYAPVGREVRESTTHATMIER